MRTEESRLAAFVALATLKAKGSPFKFLPDESGVLQQPNHFAARRSAV